MAEIRRVVSGGVSTRHAVTGTLTIGESGRVPSYKGDYTVTPQAADPVILETSGKKMLDDVTVEKIPYFETSNPFGETVYIGAEV